MNWYNEPTKFNYYAVKLDELSPKLLILNTKQKILNFHKKYITLYEEKYNMPNWKKIQTDGYYGIYFKIFEDLLKDIHNSYNKQTKMTNKKLKRQMTWYLTLDCSCFCIWNNKLILDIKEIKV